ncbi:uncharacterized protein LOC141910581 [Tubulanus polymorphus]|uniref:uncharacterized protein LOC141910581 n=1 Tax=Tubulanus polymorphus TaxID=672921 RepID=UPI003DA3F4D2
MSKWYLTVLVLYAGYALISSTTASHIDGKPCHVPLGTIRKLQIRDLNSEIQNVRLEYEIDLKYDLLLGSYRSGFVFIQKENETRYSVKSTDRGKPTWIHTFSFRRPGTRKYTDGERILFELYVHGGDTCQQVYQLVLHVSLNTDNEVQYVNRELPTVDMFSASTLNVRQGDSFELLAEISSRNTKKMMLPMDGWGLSDRQRSRNEEHIRRMNNTVTENWFESENRGVVRVHLVASDVEPVDEGLYCLSAIPRPEGNVTNFEWHVGVCSTVRIEGSNTFGKVRKILVYGSSVGIAHFYDDPYNDTLTFYNGIIPVSDKGDMISIVAYGWPKPYIRVVKVDQYNPYNGEIFMKSICNVEEQVAKFCMLVKGYDDVGPYRIEVGYNTVLESKEFRIITYSPIRFAEPTTEPITINDVDAPNDFTLECEVTSRPRANVTFYMGDSSMLRQYWRPRYSGATKLHDSPTTQIEISTHGNRVKAKLIVKNVKPKNIYETERAYTCLATTKYQSAIKRLVVKWP